MNFVRIRRKWVRRDGEQGQVRQNIEHWPIITNQTLLLDEWKDSWVINDSLFFSEYPLVEDLVTMTGCRKIPRRKMPAVLAAELTNLCWEDWAGASREHPDRALTEYMVGGIREGLRIGFNYQHHFCKRSKTNMHSALEHPDAVQAYLKNVQQEEYWAPLTPSRKNPGLL